MKHYPKSKLVFDVSTTAEQHELFQKLNDIVRPEYQELVEMRQLYEIAPDGVEVDTLLVIFHTVALVDAVNRMQYANGLDPFSGGYVAD